MRDKLIFAIHCIIDLKSIFVESVTSKLLVPGWQAIDVTSLFIPCYLQHSFLSTEMRFKYPVGLYLHLLRVINDLQKMLKIM